ncbi:MAG: hypothetical protein LBH98_00165 [Chitinispirillales bacterium]|jgi:lipopolysaccharide assembly outer membrane protein LptD (OstA)|nr:hypothetical protein [Chitinispirillales bacterium]
MIKKYFLLIFTCIIYAFPQTDTLDYSADLVEYSRKDSTITLSGNASIYYKGIKLTADSIFYFTNIKTMIANGSPILIDGTDTLYGEYIIYDIEKRTGKVKYGSVRSNENKSYYGEKILYGDSAIYAYHGSYSTCMFPDSPHYRFYCEKIKVVTNDKTVAKPFVLVIADAPVAALPYFIIPLEKDRTSGWLPIRWGVTLNGRGNIDNVGYYWAINDYLDFMLAGKVDNFENFLIKAETRYALKNVLTGNIYTDYLINNQYMGRYNRWSLNFSHDQNLLPDKSFTLRGSGQLVSDKKYFNEFSDDTLLLINQELSSSLSLTKRFDEIGGYASLSWNRNQNLQRETVEQDLPTFNFTLNNRSLVPLKEGDSTQNLLNKLSWSYSYKANQKILERNKSDSSYYKVHRGMSHSIPVNLPFNIFNYIKITPNFTINESFFDSYRDTASVIDTIFEKLYDTIPLENANYIEYAGREKDTVFYPNNISPDTVFVLVYRDDTTWTQKRYDTTYYYDKNYKASKAHQVWWNTGVNISTDLYGVLPLKIGKMQGIRHTLSPSVGYRFTPQKDLDVNFLSIGILSPSGTKRRQDLSFGLNNLFETKILNTNSNDSAKSSVKKINLLSLNVSSSYNFEADSQKLSDISLSASIPAPKVSFSYSGGYHPYDMRNNLDVPKPLSHVINVTPILPSLGGNFWSGDAILHDGLEYYGYLDNLWRNNSRDWQITITPRYTYTMNRENTISDFKTNKSYNLGAGLQFNLTERWKISWNGNWSFTENTFINQNVALYADLECWDLKLDWYPSGVNSGRIYFVAALKKHRDLKWEQKEK